MARFTMDDVLEGQKFAQGLLTTGREHFEWAEKRELRKAATGAARALQTKIFNSESRQELESVEDQIDDIDSKLEAVASMSAEEVSKLAENPESLKNLRESLNRKRQELATSTLVEQQQMVAEFQLQNANNPFAQDIAKELNANLAGTYKLISDQAREAADLNLRIRQQESTEEFQTGQLGIMGREAAARERQAGVAERQVGVEEGELALEREKADMADQPMSEEQAFRWILSQAGFQGRLQDPDADAGAIIDEAREIAKRMVGGEVAEEAAAPATAEEPAGAPKSERRKKLEGKMKEAKELSEDLREISSQLSFWEKGKAKLFGGGITEDTRTQLEAARTKILDRLKELGVPENEAFRAEGYLRTRGKLGRELEGLSATEKAERRARRILEE